MLHMTESVELDMKLLTMDMHKTKTSATIPFALEINVVTVQLHLMLDFSIHYANQGHHLSTIICFNVALFNHTAEVRTNNYLSI